MSNESLEYSWEEIPRPLESEKFLTAGRSKAEWIEEKRKILVKLIAEALFRTDPETYRFFKSRDKILQFALQAEYNHIESISSLMMWAVNIHYYAEQISSKKISIHLMEVNGVLTYIETKNSPIIPAIDPQTR